MVAFGEDGCEAGGGCTDGGTPVLGCLVVGAPGVKCGKVGVDAVAGFEELGEALLTAHAAPRFWARTSILRTASRVTPRTSAISC